MTPQVPQISDDDARLLWQRAAELQNDAERAAASVPHSSPADSSQLSLDRVTQAAEGAGISANFVLMAMAEQQLPDADEIRRDQRRARWLRAAVSATDSIEVARLVRGSPSAVLAALKRVAGQSAFNMLLENSLGTAGELRDRAFVFRLQGGLSQFNSTLNFADVRVLLVTLRPVQEGTHVRIRAPLFRRGVNLSIAGIATTLGGVGGSWSGWSIAGWAAGAMGIGAGSALLIPAGVAALAGGALGLGAFRSLYNSLAKQGHGAITSYLASVSMEIESTTSSLPDPQLSASTNDDNVGA